MSEKGLTVGVAVIHNKSNPALLFKRNTQAGNSCTLKGCEPYEI